MKTKFETNVAQEIPKTRMTQEPGLPWKLNPEDFEKVSAAKDEYNSAFTAASPLKTRPIFLIILLAVIFVTVIYFTSFVVTDNENTHTAAQKKEVTLSSLQTSLEKINTEKNTLSENIGQLEKRVSELSAQKELFATVIESLTKKGDEPATQGENEKTIQQETVNTQTAVGQNTAQAQSAAQETNSIR